MILQARDAGSIVPASGGGWRSRAGSVARHVLPGPTLRLYARRV